MPRLTNKTYLSHCHELREQWLDVSRNAFLLLTAREQWALYAYFLPQEDLTDAELIEHREDITIIDRSLPQRAGRAYARMTILSARLAAYRESARLLPKHKRGAPIEITLLGEVHPALDPQDFLHVFESWMRSGHPGADDRSKE